MTKAEFQAAMADKTAAQIVALVAAEGHIIRPKDKDEAIAAAWKVYRAAAAKSSGREDGGGSSFPPRDDVPEPDAAPERQHAGGASVCFEARSRTGKPFNVGHIVSGVVLQPRFVALGALTREQVDALRAPQLAPHVDLRVKA